MWDTYPPGILVAIGPDGSGAALHLAAIEAERRGCGVHLVHVLLPSYRHRSDLGPVPVVDVARRVDGAEVLATAREVLESLLHGPVVISTELAIGDVVRTLVAESRHAQLVVLERGRVRDDGRVGAALAVAAGSAGPVAVVPAQWREAHRSGRRVVCVGVAPGGGSAPIVREALASAERSGSMLRMVHGWGEALTGSHLPEIAGAARSELLHAQLVDELAEVLADRPQVPVEVVVRREHPADLLREQSAYCDLVVVGRHQVRLPFGQHLGTVAQSVLREGRVPALVLGPGSTLATGIAQEPAALP